MAATIAKERVAKVVVEPPGPKAKEALAEFRQQVSSVMYNILPDFVPDHGEGSRVTDVDGNVYLDFLTGVGVNAIGHSHPEVVEAIAAQAKRGIHFNTHVGPLPIYGRFLKRIKGTAPEGLREGKGFLGNSGAEAVEAAFKLARYYTGKPTIIALDPCFHGRTGAVLAATTGAKGRAKLGGVLTGVVHAKYPYAYRAPEGVDVADWAIGTIEDILLKHSPPENVAAVVMETIAGEPGVIVPPSDYIPRLRRLCDEKGILYIADEVQMGLGKTGKWWAVQHFNTTPDIMTFAKPAGGGLPLGGIIATQKVADAWSSGHHASTFGGNPVACAAGLATIDVIEREGLVDRAAKQGERVLKRLNELQSKHEIIGDVRGKGMVFGLELVTDRRAKMPAAKEAAAVKTNAFKRGLLTSTTGPYGNVVRLTPALNITEEEADEGIDILDESFAMLRK